MPTLDLSEVFNNEDFEDTLVLTQTLVIINAQGRSESHTIRHTISGVVTSDKGRTRDLIAEGQREAGSILVHSRTRLTPGSADRLADILRWHGRDYIVGAVDDYSGYGAGFVCAHCDLKPLSGGSDAP
jgi:hypothetical protein